MTEKDIAKQIPHEYRVKILLEWLPVAKADFSNDQFKLLWEAYFIYIDPNATKQPNCPDCRNNVLNNWRHLAKVIAEVEQEYNLLESVEYSNIKTV